MTLSPLDEERHQHHLENAARVILKSDYPTRIKLEMQTAFDQERYQDVLDLAAEHDVPGREELDRKISMIPNPNFKIPDEESIEEAVMENLLNAANRLLNPESVPATEREEMEKQLKEGRMYEVEEDEPRFLFTVEGVEGTFKSAAKAIAAYQEKQGKGKVKAKHSFKRNPKFVTVDSPPEEIVQAIPKNLNIEWEDTPTDDGETAYIHMAKKLREYTGRAMLDCRRAVEKANGNIQEALSLLLREAERPTE